MKRGAYSILALLLLIAVSCASTSDWRETTRASVVAATQVYDATMQSLGEMHRAGLLSEEAKQQSIVAANAYRTAALAALAATEVGTAEQTQEHIADMQRAALLLAELLRDAMNDGGDA